MNVINGNAGFNHNPVVFNANGQIEMDQLSINLMGITPAGLPRILTIADTLRLQNTQILTGIQWANQFLDLIIGAVMRIQNQWANLGGFTLDFWGNSFDFIVTNGPQTINWQNSDVVIQGYQDTIPVSLDLYLRYLIVAIELNNPHGIFV
jgi:hypothetical protein